MNGGFRTVFGFACFLACFWVVWALRATLLYSVDESIKAPLLKALYSELVKLLLWVVPAVGYVQWVRRESLLNYWGLLRSPDRRHWISCLAATAFYLLAVISFEAVLGHKSLSWAAVASQSLAIIGLSLLLSPFMEEFFFRGFVMKELLGFTTVTTANLLTSVLFVSVHLPYWLSHGGVTQGLLINCAGIFLFSLLAGWLFARSGSVWPPVVAHVANNLVAMLLVATGAMR